MKEGELGRLYADGDIIFQEGDRADVMYVIQSGKVRIMKRSASGDIHMVTLRGGDIFGEMALFDKLPRSASAVAEGDSRILSIDKKKLFSTISNDPTVVLKIIETMSGTIRRLSNDISALKKKGLDKVFGTMDLEEISNLVLEEARNNFAVENGSIMFLDEQKVQLYIKAAFGVEAREKVHLAIGEGIAGDVLRSGKAELVNDVSLDSRFKPGSLEIRSLICAPLKYDGACFGVLNVSSGSENQFTLDNLKLLHSFARYASITLKNAIIISELKCATEEVFKHASILGEY